MTDRSTTSELLVWTENYWIGGCDRFLVDLIHGLADRPVKISLAGNVHPRFDEWLAARAPNVLPRETLPIANLVQSPLHELERRVRRATRRSPAPPASASGTAPADGGPLARDAAIAAVRYAQDVVNLRRLRALMRRRRPDVLLINNGGYPGGESCRLIALAARDAGVPRILHFVHNMANPPAWPSAVERALDRRIDRVTDAWITAAHRASAALGAARPITREHVHTVHYGLAPGEPAAPADPAELGYAPDALALVAIANLEPRKGIGTLIRALAILRDRGIPVRTAIVGDGPLRGQLEDDARELSLDDRVRFTGWRDDVQSILAASDVLVLPSLSHECLPYVILEAMASRLPVVSTDVAGIPEMVLDGETGRVVAPGEHVALAEALQELAASEDRGRAMGERGYERVREAFGLERMVAEMSALIGLA